MSGLARSTLLMTPAAFARDQFHRVPAWRYERARGILQGQVPRLAVNHEDDLVRQYVAFLRDEERLRRAGLREFDVGMRLASRWPEIYSAYEFKQQPPGTVSRAALEACVLSGMTDEEIATRMKRDPLTIELYRELYWDIADRLDVQDYIAGFVLAPVLQAGVDTLNTELLAKYFGYAGGPLVLDLVLYGLTRQHGLSSDDEVIGYFERSTQNLIKYQTMVTIALTQPSRFDVRTLIEGYQAIVTLERSAREGQPEHMWLAGLTEVLRNVNITPRSRDERSRFQDVVNSPEKAYREQRPEDSKAPAGLRAEPRTAERYALANGELSKNEMVEKLSEFTLPEPGSLTNAGFQDRK